MDSLQTATPIVPGAPEWLTLPFVLIAAGVALALLILFVGARKAGKRRRVERTLEERGEVQHVEGFEVGRPITPPASPIPPGPPETFDEPLPPPPPEPIAESPEPEPIVEAAPEPEPETVAEAPAPEPAPEPEPEPVAEEPVAEPVHEPEHLEGAPVREPEPEPTPEAPNPAAEPLDAGPAGEESALAEPPVAAEGETLHAPLAAEPEPESAPEPEPAAAPAADDLTRMKGVGPRLAERLNTVGIASFAQIAALSPEAAAALDSQLGDFQGRLDRDRWIDQARFLAAGDVAGFEETFGKL